MTNPNEPITACKLRWQSNQNALEESILPEFDGFTYMGLTKREYFASDAMKGYLSSDPANENSQVKQTAEWAVKMADALIEALNKEK